MRLHNEVARVAYELFEKHGRVHGRDLEHWLDAERIVSERRDSRRQSVKTPDKKTARLRKTVSSGRNGGKENSEASSPKGAQRRKKVGGRI